MARMVQDTLDIRVVHEKRYSQFMAIRQHENDENGITSSMENMHIDTETETID